MLVNVKGWYCPLAGTLLGSYILPPMHLVTAKVKVDSSFLIKIIVSIKVILVLV
jgi:hypothetical protein